MHGAFGDTDAELQELAADALGAPERVISRHRSDKAHGFRSNARHAAKAVTMRAEYGLRLDQPAECTRRNTPATTRPTQRLSSVSTRAIAASRSSLVRPGRLRFLQRTSGQCRKTAFLRARSPRTPRRRHSQPPQLLRGDLGGVQLSTARSARVALDDCPCGTLNGAQRRGAKRIRGGLVAKEQAFAGLRRFAGARK
jgi:hypothetical protein